MMFLARATAGLWIWAVGFSLLYGLHGIGCAGGSGGSGMWCGWPVSGVSVSTRSLLLAPAVQSHPVSIPLPSVPCLSLRPLSPLHALCVYSFPRFVFLSPLTLYALSVAWYVLLQAVWPGLLRFPWGHPPHIFTIGVVRPRPCFLAHSSIAAAITSIHHMLSLIHSFHCLPRSPGSLPFCRCHISAPRGFGPIQNDAVVILACSSLIVLLFSGPSPNLSAAVHPTALTPPPCPALPPLPL